MEINNNHSTNKTSANMPDNLSFSQLARSRGCRPRDLSDLFYARQLDETKLILIRGRRYIPSSYVPEVIRVLTERGRIRPELANG